MSKLSYVLTTILVLLCLHTSVSAAEKRTVVKLGDTSVVIAVTKNGSGPLFVGLHENENTSIAAAKKAKGTLIELRHGGQRNVSFTLKGVKYTIDPNRIFTSVGIKKNLKPYSQPAHAAVSELAKEILLQMRFAGGAPIVALHNNTNGGYSVLSYKPGADKARDAKDVSINPKHDPDDFFFTVSSSLFSRLKQKGYNVVLQGRAVDDGSLSVYCARNCSSYVNVETQHGHGQQYREMLNALH